jgi:CHAT domain-containing protein/Flp pilus assembly protein TadD
MLRFSHLLTVALFSLLSLTTSIAQNNQGQKQTGELTLKVQLDEANRLDEQVVKLFSEANYEQALKLAQQSLTLRKAVLPSDDPLLAESLFNVASLHFRLGSYELAEPLFKESLEIREKRLAADDLDLARSLNSLAGLYQAMGDYGRAEDLFKRALDIRMKKLGPDNAVVAGTMKNLGLNYKDKRDYAKAEELLLRSLNIYKKVLGREDHPAIASVQNALAVVCQEQGDLDRAEQFYKPALETQQKAFSPDNPELANTLHNLAVLYLLKKDFAKAEPLYQRSVENIEKTLGPQHPLFANALQSISIMYQVKGDLSRAIEFQRRSQEIREHNLALVIATGSEQQKRLYMNTLDIETDIAISLHVTSAPQNTDAASLALTAILRRKGRLLDTMANIVETLRNRSSAKDRELLEQLADVRSKLASTVVNGLGQSRPEEYQAKLTKLENERDVLEAAISERSAEFRSQASPINLESIQKAIPDDSALVEISTYRPFDPLAVTKSGATRPARYVAYVLKKTGPPLWVELGDAAEIDRNAAKFRNLLADWNTDVEKTARALDQQVMQPMRNLVQGTQKLFVSTDGGLNLIPFSALIDEHDRYLVETYRITYLTSGRDLLRLQSQKAGNTTSVLIANPAFNRSPLSGNPPTAANAKAGPAQRTADLKQAIFQSLPGTASEGAALKRILPNVTLLTGTRATEATLKHVNAPRILHIATHGFFLPNVDTDLKVQRENPLLRSGIVLAGVNKRQGGDGEDGILTAFEATGLDLWGTKIVVLSACETGLGEVRNGDGVYGLRRALVLAGAESQVMSLWKVDDIVTRDLMVDYYTHLQAGEGRTEALREVQLQMLRNVKKNRTHPYYWASFIQSGDWQPITRPH